MENLINWVSGNWIEITGAIISLIYLFFSYKQLLLLWPFGLLSAIFYTWIYFDSGFYADMGLQLYYIGISIYGWIYWSGNEKPGDGKGTRKICMIKKREIAGVSLAFLALWIVISVILIKLTDSQVPVMDGFTTAGGIAATWMLARKMLEHWLVWVVVDGVSLGLYIYKGLYATSFLFLVYTLVAVAGFYEWRKSFREDQ
jgi:nicotinamide mononucleotide transporter